MIRRTFTWFAVGIILGLVLSMFFGPSFIRWWWRTPGQPTSFSCDPMIKTATEWLVRLQLMVGCGLGIVLAIIANLIARGRRLKAAANPPEPPAKPS